MTAAPKFFKLADYERNGYDDSDGYLIYWDAEKQEVCQTLCWTTRGGMEFDYSPYAAPTKEVVVLACEWMAKKMLRQYRRALIRNHYEPDGKALARGDEVKLREKHGGKNKAEKGERGRVFWVGVDTYRTAPWSQVTWYRVGLEMADGRKVFVPGEKLRRPGRPKSETRAQSFEKCRNAAAGCGFTGFFGGAWDSNNFAKAALREVA